MEITGLVLCGGRSMRMGTDKGLLLKNGKSWARFVADKILALNIPFKISINPNQVNEYGVIFKDEELIVDQVDISGPLKGILSAHLQYPEKNWLILACDMLEMDVETLQRLLKAAQEVPGNEFYVYKNEKFYEPFGGIYTAAGLQKLYELYRNNLLTNFSMQYVLNKFETYSISIKNNNTAFSNYNSL
ncbi:MAG: molybdenum cofactor guanylyltransferase [Daejeonella sp.]